MNNRVLVFALVAVAGCDRVFGIGDPYEDARGGDATNDGPGGGPRYRKKITIAQPTATPLSDFPVSILEIGDSDLVSHVLDGGGADIGFADESSRPLPCEIVGFDPATGKLDAWVLPPTLPASPATVAIELVYGAQGTGCTTSPWTSSHVGVWHAGRSPSNASLDSTSHAHDLAQAGGGTTPPGVVDGLVGKALAFDGVSNSLCAATDADGSLAFGTTSFSYGLWINAISVAPNEAAFEHGGGSSSQGFGIFFPSSLWTGEQNDNAHTPPLVESIIGADLNRWINMVVVVDREAGVVRSYADGIAAGSTSLSGYGSMTASVPLCVSPMGAYIHGMLDEMRIYAGTLSPEWVNAAWSNVENRGAMISIGPEVDATP